MTTVTLADIRAIKFCSRGSREWFDRYGLDWSRFVSEGLPVAAFDGINDPMLKRAIEQAQKREAANGQQ